MNENDKNRFFNSQNEIIQNYSQKQEKYVYYLIALCVTAIGFSVQLTTGTELNYFHIPLGLALIFWSVAIFYGLKFLRFSLNIIYLNNEQFKIAGKQDKYKEIEDDNVSKPIEEVSNIINSEAEKQKSFFKLLNLGFYFGVLSFLVWHILEMI